MAEAHRWQKSKRASVPTTIAPRPKATEQNRKPTTKNAVSSSHPRQPATATRNRQPSQKSGLEKSRCKKPGCFRARLIANDCTLYHTLWGVVRGVTSKVSTGLIVFRCGVGRSSKTRTTTKTVRSVQSRQSSTHGQRVNSVGVTLFASSACRSRKIEQVTSF